MAPKNRHFTRSIIIQFLYEVEISGKSFDNLQESFNEILNNFYSENIESFDSEFAIALVEVLKEKKSIIDNIIQIAAPKKPIDRILITIISVLRLSLAELLFFEKEDVPPKVTLNEAVELAKDFGDVSSYKFVNGVIGHVYREMGEPGKDNISFSNSNLKQSTNQKFSYFIYHIDEQGEIFVLLAFDIFNTWILPKCSESSFPDISDDKEIIKEGIKRDLPSLNIEVDREFCSNSYPSNSENENEKVLINIKYFLVKAEEKLTLSPSSDDKTIKSFEWFNIKSLSEIKMYSNMQEAVEYASNILTKKNEK